VRRPYHTHTRARAHTHTHTHTHLAHDLFYINCVRIYSLCIFWAKQPRLSSTAYEYKCVRDSKQKTTNIVNKVSSNDLINPADLFRFEWRLDLPRFQFVPLDELEKQMFPDRAVRTARHTKPQWRIAFEQLCDKQNTNKVTLSTLGWCRSSALFQLFFALIA